MEVMLGDGTYDAIVVDVGSEEDGAVAVDLAIAAGEHRGDVVRVIERAHDGDPVDLLGVPATLTVVDGQPSVIFEP
jgi:hypothetical protein